MINHNENLAKLMACLKEPRNLMIPGGAGPMITEYRDAKASTITVEQTIGGVLAQHKMTLGSTRDGMRVLDNHVVQGNDKQKAKSSGLLSNLVRRI
jgi:hypothetical protein